MKDYFNLRKSTGWHRACPYIFALFALLAGGVSPAWADDSITEQFSTSDWPEGWSISTNSSSSDYYVEYDASNDYSYPSGRRGVYGQVASGKDKYIITPVVNGNGSFKFKRRNSSNGSVYVYTIESDGSLSSSAITSNTNKPTSFISVSFSGVDNKRLAIVLNGRIDDFIYTPGTEAPVEGPKLAVKDGTTTIASPYTFDFGNVTPGTTHEFTLSNAGTADLGVSVSETGSFDATLSATTVPAGGEVTLTITMPATTGSSDITITPAEGSGIDPFVINASATVAANFAIDPSSAQSFGMVLPNAAAEKLFTITNSGNAALPVTFTDAEDFYVAKTVMFTKPAGWGDINIYAWDSSDNPLTSVWPGDKVAISSTNDYSETIYTAALPKGAVGVIFNDGTNQTSDISTSDFQDVVGLWLDGTEVKQWKNESFSVPAAGSASFFVKMAAATTGAKSGEIALAFTASNATSATIDVSGYVADNSKFFEGFSGNALPEGWSGGSGWTFADGNAHASSSSELVLPAMTIADGEKMAISVNPTSAYSSSLYYYTSTDGGETWSARSSDLITSSVPTNAYSVVFIEGVAAGNYMVKLQGSYIYIDAVNGFTKNENAPKVGRYSDEACTVAVAKSVTKEFGFVTAAPEEATKYYLKNDGTGTMTLSLGDVPTGFTASLDKTSVAAGDKATLTINIDATQKGYHDGNIVVTAAGLSDFTVAVSGVMVDESKMNLDFATDNIPAAWTVSEWEKKTGGYIEAYYNEASLVTTALTAAAGEQLVVVAKNTYTTSSYTFGVKYKKVGDEEWSDLIAAVNQGTTFKMLVGTIAEAGDYLLQFNGKYAQIQRIYGLEIPNAPAMVVYDGETAAAATFSFGKVNDETPVTHEFTVKNEGKAPLTGLAIALSGDNADAYTATIAEGKTGLAAGESATITVTQKAVIGTHSATLTISADGLDSKEIALSGETVDHTILNIDFDTSNAWPVEIMEPRDGWSVYNYNGSGEARQGSTSTATPLTLAPLTVASTDDKLTFDVAYYSSSANRELTVSYTTDGGLTWTNYNWGTAEEPVYDLKETSEGIGYSYATKTITGIPAGTVVFKFTGKSIKLDNISGDMKVAQAPLVAFTTVEDNISDANLKADATATYTLANNGNADYVATVGTTNVTPEFAGDDVTFASNTLTVPAGKTATITVKMAFAAPYGEKTGNLSITSESWVGDLSVDYTATLVDPTSFVEDFTTGKPAGWYSEGWSYANGVASVSSGVEKPMITELVGVEEGKNVLSFDAWSTSDGQTLNVYTSTDRKEWSEATAYSLTTESQTFTLNLTGTQQYIKFGAAIATVENIKGVKKLALPEYDLYLVSSTLPTEDVTPGSTYTATLNVASLVATESVKAELYFGDTMTPIATKTQEIGSTATTIELTCTAPVAGTYNVYAVISAGNTEVRTAMTSVTVADTYKLNITDFAALDTSVEADEDNNFTATFTVTVENTGTGSIAANDVSVSLTNSANTEDVFTATWTAENSNVLYMNTEKDGTDIATDCTLKAWCWNTPEDGIWAAFSNINPGFWSVDLQGKTNFKVCRFNPAGTDENPWDNVWNASDDLSLASGNLVKFTGYNGNAINFSSESMTMLEPTMSTTLKVTVIGTVTEDATRSYTAKENVSNTSFWQSKSVSIIAYKTLALNESESFENATTTDYKKVTLTRPFIAGWNTVVLPFDIDAETFSSKFGGADAAVYAFTNNNEGELTFTKTTDGIKAGTPYLLNLPVAIADAMEFTNVTVYPSLSAYIHDANSFGAYFRGNYAAGFDMEGKYGITPQGEVKKGAAGSTMKPFRAYIEMPNGQSARIAIVDETTGISRVLTSKEIENLNIFNLNGQKVEENAKGVVIVNGKKVVRK